MKKAQPRSTKPDVSVAPAGLRLLETYAGLAARGEHLPGRLLAGQVPRQWAHYPEDDAIDRSSGYQWFYHSNSWVTGDLMLGAELAQELLSSMRLDTGHSEIDAVIESVARLCEPELRELMQWRDDALRSHPVPDKLQDEALELLSEVRIDLDASLSALSEA